MEVAKQAGAAHLCCAYALIHPSLERPEHMNLLCVSAVPASRTGSCPGPSNIKVWAVSTLLCA
eukprot:scaffold45830_cov19-Tisochrysis_lutea.AAC.1